MLGVVRGQDKTEYVIDLDVRPALRYIEIMLEYRDLMLQVYEGIKARVNEKLWKTIAEAYKTIAITRYREYAEEIAGMAYILNISAADYYVLNCFYEIIVMCTSIVARDKNNKPVLARNFDFIFPEVLRMVHIDVVYMKEGAVVAKCGNIAGYTGVFTCLKPYAFAAAINARPIGNIEDFITRLLAGRILTTWLLREAVLKSPNYGEALKLVTRAQTVTGSYIILAGMKENEGAVITRARDSVFSVRKLSNETWYLAKCNSDDNVTNDTRTNWVNNKMKELGQANIDLDVLKNDVLLKPPLFGSFTISTIMMSPSNGYYKSNITNTETDKEQAFLNYLKS
jgi:hypothetical protein